MLARAAGSSVKPTERLEGLDLASKGVSKLSPWLECFSVFADHRRFDA